MLVWVNAKAGLNARVLLEQLPVGEKGWGKGQEGGRCQGACGAGLSPVRERAREGWVEVSQTDLQGHQQSRII